MSLPVKTDLDTFDVVCGSLPFYQIAVDSTDLTTLDIVYGSLPFWAVSSGYVPPVVNTTNFFFMFME